MKIFIAEDEKTFSCVLAEKFIDNKHKVKIVESGADVVKQVRKFEPDIILLDLVLPDKNGLYVLEELKSDSKLKAIPVILLSNLAEKEKTEKALALGAKDYLVKTEHSIKEIVERVESFLCY